MKLRLPMLVVLGLCGIVSIQSAGRLAAEGEVCGDCDGRVVCLTLRYDGASTADVRVEQRSDGGVVFSGSVAPGGTFEFCGTVNGTLGPEVFVFVNDEFHTSFHTSCSSPIGPGTTGGDFVVVSGSSRNGGPLCEAPECPSADGTNEFRCYRDLSTAELERLINGTTENPFNPPIVCGLVVATPADALAVLNGTECRGFRYTILAAMFNVRRSILFGDGLLGEGQMFCYTEDNFRYVLRCGDIFVPDESTPDPDDAVVAHGLMTVNEFIAVANQFCVAAGCPDDNAPCGDLLFRLKRQLGKFNRSRKDIGDCPLCPGDETPPVIDCPTQRLTFECEGETGATITYQVNVTDDCDPAPALSCFPPPGTILPVGVHEIHCSALDINQNYAECDFEVEVVDTTPPTISCPEGPIMVDCVPGAQNGAVVDYPEPVVNDTCDGEVTVTCTPPSGSLFPFGSTTVTCVAIDGSGNSSECDFEIVVVEETPPTLTCAGDIDVECASHDGTVVDYPAPMLSESCNPPPNPTCEPPSGSTFPLGTTVVTCSTTASDGSLVSCEFSVTVSDSIPPTIICPENIQAECGSPDGNTVFFEATASDICDANPTVTCDPPSGSVFPIGETVVTCTAVDASGNSSECTFKVTILDTTPPEISCPEGPITVGCTRETGESGATVEYPAPSVSDLCDDAVSVVCTPPSGSFFPLGVHTVECVATDASGNAAECSFEIHVVDEAPPALVCMADITRECTSPEGAVVEYDLPIAMDDCDAPPTVTCTPPSGSLFPIGTTTVTCSSTDASGNTAECTFKIVVQDTRPPAISCPCRHPGRVCHA